MSKRIIMDKIKDILNKCWQKVCAFWSWYKKLYQGRAWYTKTAVGIASAIVCFVLYLGMVDINFLWLFGKSPGFSQIKHPATPQASEIYSAIISRCRGFCQHPAPGISDFCRETLIVTTFLPSLSATWPPRWR